MRSFAMAPGRRGPSSPFFLTLSLIFVFTVPVLGAGTLTIYEQTGSINTYTFDLDDIRLYHDTAGMPGPPAQGYIGYDFGTGGCEYYDIYFCDSAGVVLEMDPGDPLPLNIFLKLECWDLSCNNYEPVSAPNWVSAGNNIDAVKLDIDGEVLYGAAVAGAVYGLCDEPFELKTSNFAESALGPPDADITKMGCGYTEITLFMGSLVPEPPDSTLEHDPLTAIGNAWFDWIENGIGWVPAEDGFIYGNVPYWDDALISRRAFDPAEKPVMIFRVFNAIGTSNFMGGFTSALPPANDFHYSNIDIGIYLHSTGTIRPTWDVNNASYWSTTLSAGFYDIMIALDDSAGTVTLAIDDVADWYSPLSDFSWPVWSSVEQRPIGGPYHLQINPYNEGSRIYDVWASGSGTMPPPPPPPPEAAPRILFVEDIGKDEGRQVRLKWQASPMDSATSLHPVTGYALWRRIDPLPLGTEPVCAAVPEPAPLYPPGDWDYLVTVPACCERTYATVLPTLADSTGAGGIHWSVFFVRALTGTPSIYFDSPPDSGYSVDDLAPALTGGFGGAQSLDPPGLRLYWEPGAEPDIVCYDVHKGEGEDFIPGGSNLIGSTAGTEMLDTGWTPADQYFYKIIAVDDSGNRGPAALLRPENILVGTLLQSFTGSWEGSWAEIAWTLSEADDGTVFHLLRAEGPARVFVEIEGARLERDGLSFVIRDLTCVPGEKYIYRVELEENGTRRVLFETEEINVPALPLTLRQNVPNPFNPSTSIEFYLPGSSRVRLDVFDVTGRLVSTLLDENRPAGTHSVEWNGSDPAGRPAASGVYFYRLVAGKDALTRKMILLR